MKQDPDFFEGKEPSLIYIAKKLKEALALEEVLTAAGVDYGVEPDRYKGGFVFQTERIGAFFTCWRKPWRRRGRCWLPTGIVRTRRNNC